MAEILEHPQSEEKFNEWVLPLANGIVKLEVTDGQPLTIERANFMIDMAKHELWEMMRERNKGHHDE